MLNCKNADFDGFVCPTTAMYLNHDCWIYINIKKYLFTIIVWSHMEMSCKTSYIMYKELATVYEKRESETISLKLNPDS